MGWGDYATEETTAQDPEHEDSHVISMADGDPGHGYEVDIEGNDCDQLYECISKTVTTVLTQTFSFLASTHPEKYNLPEVRLSQITLRGHLFSFSLKYYRTKAQSTPWEVSSLFLVSRYEGFFGHQNYSEANCFSFEASLYKGSYKNLEDGNPERNDRGPLPRTATSHEQYSGWTFGKTITADNIILGPKTSDGACFQQSRIPINLDGININYFDTDVLKVEICVCLDGVLPAKEKVHLGAPPALLHGMQALYSNADYQDVVFIFPEHNEKRFEANKSILACSSPVFKKMFSEGFAEGSASKVETKVHDLCPVAFGEFLRYLHGFSIDLSLFPITYKYDKEHPIHPHPHRNSIVKAVKTEDWSDDSISADQLLCSLIRIADKYQVSELLEILERAAHKYFTAENIAGFLQVAYLCDLEELNISCTNWIMDKNHPARYKLARETADFKKLSPDCKQALLDGAHEIILHGRKRRVEQEDIEDTGKGKGKGKGGKGKGKGKVGETK